MKDEDTKMTEKKFEAAVNVIRSLPKDGPYQPSHDMMLKFYGLYKQATEGPCKDPKPSFFEVVKGYKWKAWTALGDMSKEQAMNSYVDELKKIVETMCYSEDVATFIQTLGPFYEYVDIPSLKNADKNHNITKVYLKNGSSSNGRRDSDDSMGYRGRNDEERDNDVIQKSMLEDGVPLQSEALSLNGGTNGLEFIDVGKAKNLAVSDSDESWKSGEGTRKKGNELKSNGVNRLSSAFKKILSDTESDEEYSEPAETPEVLRQNQIKNSTYEYGDEDGFNESENFPSSDHQGYWPLRDENVRTATHVGVTTYGGGDAADAGRVRFAQDSQFARGSGRNRSFIDENGGSQAPLSSGGGGRRRGNNPPSGDGLPPSPAFDFDTRLFFILRKIQQDIESVALRMDALELQAIHQHQQLCRYCQRRSGSDDRGAWWPFPELSPRSTFFLLAWPIVVGGAVGLLRAIRRRHKKNI